MDPLMKNPIKRLMQQKSFVQSLSRGKGFFRMGAGYFTWELPVQAIKAYRNNDAAIVQTLMSRKEATLRDLQQRMANLSGDELFAFILEAQKQLKEAAEDPRSMGVIYAGLYAANRVKKNMEKWLGEKSAVDSLSQSVANNVTSEMGLALLDVADVVRQYPAVVEYFQHANDETFFADLARLEGGDAVSHSIQAYLAKYGMRCAGEIDITRPRWSEQPTTLIPTILNNIKNFAPGAHKALFEQGLLAA
jgi:pyruvate,water dikinase